MTLRSPHLDIREAWLAQGREEVLAPEQPIFDAHHHLWDRAGKPIPDELQRSAAFYEGARALGDRNLALDVWAYDTQLDARRVDCH